MKALESCLIGPQEVSVLCDSSVPNIIVKPAASSIPDFASSSDDIYKEACRIRASGLMTRSKAAVLKEFDSETSLSQQQVQRETQFRGDEMIWLAPDLCKELDLIAVPKFVKELIRQLKQMKDTYPVARDVLRLNGDFSVQFSVYVSDLNT